MSGTEHRNHLVRAAGEVALVGHNLALLIGTDHPKSSPMWHDIQERLQNAEMHVEQAHKVMVRDSK